MSYKDNKLTKLLRAGIVLSIVWMLLSTITMYFLGKREIARGADIYITILCDRPNESMANCMKNRNKYIEENSKDNLLSLLIVAFVSQTIFWVTSVISVNAIRWIRNGR